MAPTLDVLLGARLATFKPALDWEFSGNFGPITPPPLTGSREESIEQWDAIIGARGRLAFGRRSQMGWCHITSMWERAIPISHGRPWWVWRTHSAGETLVSPGDISTTTWSPTVRSRT